MKCILGPSHLEQKAECNKPKVMPKDYLKSGNEAETGSEEQIWTKQNRKRENKK